MAQFMLLRHNSSMPKIIPQTELDAIVEIVSGFSEPVSLEQIFSHLQHRLPRRTLQRRLALLVGNGRLAGIGKRGGRRYHVPSVEKRPTEEKPQEAAYREIIPLS
jgi:hypothetical protein